MSVSTKRPGDGYSRFLRSLEPINVGLKSCQADLKRGSYQRLREPEGRKLVDRSLHDEYRLTKVSDSFFDVEAELAVEVVRRGEKIPVLSIRCVFEVHFHSRIHFDAAFADQFAKSELRVFIWPYFRSFVSDVAGRMAIAPVLIPVSLGAEGQGQSKAATSPHRRSRKA